MRIGHMGHMDRFDILTALAALEWGLAEHGYAPPSPGAGVARATELLGGAPARV
jgi:aspartate aminotransferase-like enzyme